MAANYVLLERIELNTSAASVVFSNIPQTGYTDLKIVMSTRAADSANNWYLTKIQFNTDTTSGNYSARFVGGFGSTAYSSTSSNYAGYIPSGARTANTFGNNEIYIPNYAGSTAKSYSTDSVTEGNGSSYEILGLWAGLWSGTAAINQIVLSPDTGSWAQYSTFSLYGIAAVGTTPAIAPKADGGNIVATDGTYWYHAFLSNGTFTPQVGLSCDYLVVGGGGGSSSFNAQSGGGAGGLRTATSQSLSVASYAVTVGAGGAGGVGTSAYITGSNGNPSSVNSFEAAGGGGASGSNYTAGSGGSGGGAWQQGTAGLGNTPSTSPVQGYDGAKGSTDLSTYTNGGAGGGAGGAASAAISTTRAANGGVGFYSSLTDAMGAATGTGVLSSSHYYYAGGGGGFAQAGSQGTGGTGGGGAGGGTNTGAVNTGGGAGGNNGAVNGNAGGSGIVIIRYTVA